MKKNNTKNHGPSDGSTSLSPKVILSLFIIGLSVFSYHTASANSYAVTGSYNSSATVTVTLDKTTYLSSNLITVTASADTYTNVSTVSVTVSNGITSNNIIPQTSATVSGNIATLTAEAAPGTAYGVSVDATITPRPPHYITLDAPCSGIYSTSTIHGISGSVVVLNLSFSGVLQYNGIYDARNAAMNFSVASQNVSDASPTKYYSTDGSPNGFSLSRDITFTMSSDTMPISTGLVTNNSTASMSNGALKVVSVDGITSGSTNAVCVGNSQGAF